MKRIAAALALLLIPAIAQAQSLPYAWPQLVGTTASQVLPNNPSRKQVFFHNPSASTNIAVCPAVSRKDGTNISCALNGAGSITLYPGDKFLVGGVGANPAVPSAWNAVAASPSTPLTVLEFE